MFKRWKVLILLLATVAMPAYATLTIEITGGTEEALPIAVVPFSEEGNSAPVSVSDIISKDLLSSGQFAPLAEKDLVAHPHKGSDVHFADWRLLRSDGLLIGQMTSQDGGKSYQVQYQLFDVYKKQQLLGKSYQSVPAAGLRSLAHQIADQVYQKLTGQKGVFSTRLAFIQQSKDGKGHPLYLLQVSDADGFNPRTVLQSSQPILSPAWSPDGQQLAYVSFEHNRSEVYVQNLTTGSRKVVAGFKGINSAPAWSPDGKKLAVSLSKTGSSEVYVITLATKNVLRVTFDSQSIDTSPAWSPDGKTLYFTSDRGGRPQIYKTRSDGGQAKRVSFEGAYNASPTVSPDGKTLAMVQGDGNGHFRIATQDLETGAVLVLTKTKADESPSFAPNGQTILYATEENGRGVLATVSLDGEIKRRLGEPGKDVREPAWSPYK